MSGFSWITYLTEPKVMAPPPKTLPKWKEVVLRNFSIFREQPQRTDPASAFVTSDPIPVPSSPPARATVGPTSTNSRGSPRSAPPSSIPNLDKVHVRLSLPDVHVPEEKVSPSQSSYSLPTMRRRSPVVNRTRSMDARAMPLPRLSIQGRGDPPTNQQSSVCNNEPRSPFSPYLRTPSPECLSPLPDPPLGPSSPTAGNRPRSLSPFSPLLSPAYSQPSDCCVSPGAVSPLGAIQPDLYKKKGMLFFQSSESQEQGRYGRLHFRLKYDFDKSDFVVHIIEALDLGTLSENGFNDPYVKVALLPEVDSKQRQTDIRRNCTDPFFNEVFKFPVTYDDLLDKLLLLQVFDYDRFSRNDVTGEVRVQMCDVDVSTEIEVWSEIVKSDKVSRDCPEILLSLSYLPSAGRLTVGILKASNLMAPDSKEVPDSYAKVSLAFGDKKGKKKKTSTKKGSNNPVWNEALSFDLSEEDLKHCHLVVSVVNCHHGNSPLLGTCVLGRTGHSKETAHWRDMMSNPRKSIAMWHSLHI